MRVFVEGWIAEQFVSMNLSALLETQRAFDTVAQTYNDENARNPVLCEMRRRTHEIITTQLPAGSTLLDLGCGPGPDAEFFARRKYQVIAIDYSPEMAREAERRLRACGLASRTQVYRLGIHELDRLECGSFDGAYSNLGPLNCVPDLGEAAQLIVKRLRRGGLFVASVIGRVCPWEMALYGMRGEWKRARVRFSRDFVPVPFYGRTVWTRYYSPREFEQVFKGAGLTPVSVRAMGLLLPPPYLQGFAERHPALLRLLRGVEDRVASRPLLRQWGDHFLIVMRKS
jgi:SAM-dependent methyltransferase